VLKAIFRPVQIIGAAVGIPTFHSVFQLDAPKVCATQICT